MGSSQSQNRVDLEKIAEVPGGAAQAIANRSKERPDKYINGLLPEEHKSISKMIERATPEQLADILNQVSQRVIHNIRRQENDPVLQQATSVARASNTREGQQAELEKRATKLGVKSSYIRGSPIRLVKAFSTAVYTLYDYTYRSLRFGVNFPGTKTGSLAMGVAYGWEKVAIYQICAQAPSIFRLEMRGAVFSAICVGSGALYLIFNKDLTKILLNFVRGNYDNDVYRQIAASATWMHTASIIGEKIYPTMKGYKQLNNTLAADGILMSSLDKGLTILESIPASRDGVINASKAFASYAENRTRVAAHWIAQELVIIKEKAVAAAKEALRKTAEAARAAANYVDERRIEAQAYAQDKINKGVNYMADKLSAGFNILKQRLGGTMENFRQLDAAYPVPASATNDIIDLDNPVYDSSGSQHMIGGQGGMAHLEGGEAANFLE